MQLFAPKLTAKVGWILSTGIFGVHILWLSTIALKVFFWSMWKNFSEAVDICFFAVYCLLFVVSLVVWWWVKEPVLIRIRNAAICFFLYLVVSFISASVVTAWYFRTSSFR